MALDPSRIWMRDQDKQIPNDTAFFIEVGLVSSIPMSAVSTMVQEDVAADPDADPPVEAGTQQVEIVQVNQQENIQIDIASKDNSAVLRNWEVLAALNSIFSKQTQEKNFFKIFRLPRQFINASSAEGGSMLNRYSIIFPCFAWYNQRRVLTTTGGDYYDDFRTRVDDKNTIGTDTPLIEFEITPEGIDP